MITLQVDGRELSLEEVESIVREHFSKKETTEPKVTTQKEVKPLQKPTRPTEGVLFEVKPLEIDRNLFKKKRKNEKQESTRQIILAAFADLDENPKRYGRSFKTLIPKNSWDGARATCMQRFALTLGHMADMVEQALEWAQRIQNGESWNNLCNKADTANWFRLIEQNNGKVLSVVGGSRSRGYLYPASRISNNKYFAGYGADDKIYDAVPLVVIY